MIGAVVNKVFDAVWRKTSKLLLLKKLGVDGTVSEQCIKCYDDPHRYHRGVTGYQERLHTTYLFLT